MTALAPAIKSGPAKLVKPKIGRDGWSMRIFMLVIACYLFATLVLPIGTMLVKSFSTYHIDLAMFEFQVDTGSGWGPVSSAEALNAKHKVFGPDDLEATSDSRVAVTNLFPDFSFLAPTKYRMRGAQPGAVFLFGSERVDDNEWHEYSSNDFRRVVMRPVKGNGLSNYVRYFSTPALFYSIHNSLFIASVSTIITVLIAFGLAYALNRSCMPLKGVFRLVVMIPILVPSLLPGIALVYLFGNQGVIKELLMGESIYGPIGIIIGSVFFTLPHAFIIIQTALYVSDARLYEAAASLRASKWKTFYTVTLPGARFGLISAAFVVFTLVITDFGLPKVIGGKFNVLAVDVYKQVIGQQNFEMGAVVSVILLVPALVAFTVDRIIQRRQVALLSARSVAYEPKPNRRFDGICLIYCLLVAGFVVGLLGMCQYAALVKFWPYDLVLSLKNYNFDRMDGGGWDSYWNSIRMALMTATLGTGVIFCGAYLVEKMPGFGLGRGLFQFFAMMPMAVPGLVLGLAYIFFFNDPANPLNFLYGTMAILVICSVTHFYTVGHLTALTALKQMDREFEAVSASLKQPVWRLFGKVTVPVCTPAILDISVYLFVNAMTTVSAVIFLYNSDTSLAAVAVLNMDDAGDIAPAAAMGMMIFYTNAFARLVHLMLSRGVMKRTQAWRAR